MADWPIYLPQFTATVDLRVAPPARGETGDWDAASVQRVTTATARSVGLAIPAWLACATVEYGQPTALDPMTEERTGGPQILAVLTHEPAWYCWITPELRRRRIGTTIWQYFSRLRPTARMTATYEHAPFLLYLLTHQGEQGQLEWDANTDHCTLVPR